MTVQQPNPQAAPQPVSVQQSAPQHTPATQTKEEKGFGWGHILAAGLFGFIIGQVLQIEEPAPQPQKHFWQ